VIDLMAELVINKHCGNVTFVITLVSLLDLINLLFNNNNMPKKCQ